MPESPLPLLRLKKLNLLVNEFPVTLLTLLLPSLTQSGTLTAPAFNLATVELA